MSAPLPLLLLALGQCTIVPIIAYNLIGGFVWTFGITLLVYFLGKSIPDVDKYLLPIIGVIVVVSFAPSIWHFYQESKLNKH